MVTFKTKKKIKIICHYRWLLEKKNVPSVIIGVKTMAQLEDNLGAVGWRLGAEDIEKLDTVSRLPEPYPYEMINRLNIGNNRIRD